eukprot:955511-Pleurochrysis_carterae.AAC.1
MSGTRPNTICNQSLPGQSSWMSTVIDNRTAGGFSAAICGRTSTPILTTHAFIWGVPCKCYLLRDASDRATEWGKQVMATRSRMRAATVREQAQARGLGAPTRMAPVGGAQRAAAAIGEQVSRAWGAERERSAI